MVTLHIPAGPHEITPAWLTAALRSIGTLHHAAVRAMAVNDIGAIAGHSGALVRLQLTYDTYEASAPGTLIAKFPAPDPHVRVALSRQGSYANEIRFYEDLAARLALRTPKRYYSAQDPTVHAYVLLLEDLAPARVGNDVAGCSAAEATQVVRALAGLHASLWGSATLQTATWLPTFPNEATPRHEVYQQRWPLFVEKWGHRLSPFCLEVSQRLGDTLPVLWQHFGASPVTLVHGDCRLDNLFFGTAEGGPPFAVVDWQRVRQGRGMCAVAYFLAWGLTSDLRRALERDLLQMYHTALVHHGVRGYALAQCLQDYRQGLLYALSAVVTSLALFDFTSERGMALASAILDRLAVTLHDHQVLDVMPT